MIPSISGSITINGIDLATLPRHTVRFHFNTLTQEPFFFEGTIRSNLEIFGSFSDETFQHVLETTSLSNTVETKGGLDAPMMQEEWSTGQKQLFCLARALLRKDHGILLIDEIASRYVLLPPGVSRQSRAW